MISDLLAPPASAPAPPSSITIETRRNANTWRAALKPQRGYSGPLVACTCIIGSREAADILFTEVFRAVKIHSVLHAPCGAMRDLFTFNFTPAHAKS